MSDEQTLPIEAGDEVMPESELAIEAEQTETPVQTEEPESDAETVEQDAEPDSEAGEETPEESKSKARRERRKQELARLREAEAEAQRKADERKREIERLRAEAAKLPQPKLEDYGNFDEYQAALMAYHSLKAVDAREQRRLTEQAEADARQAEEARQMQQREAAQYWEAQKEEGRTKYPDFEAVALAPDLPITPALGEVILQSDAAADVTYHLGKNPELARQISGMPPMEMARAIGRLEASLTAPKPKTVSDAPAPIAPVKPKSSAIPDISKLSMAEYKRLREAGKLR